MRQRRRHRRPIPGRPVPTGELRAICLAQGAPAGTIGSIPQPTAGQANATGGGNLNLLPEISNSYTVGAVFQPDFVPGLSLSVDYYHIKITGAVSTPTPDDAITACFGSTLGQTPAAGASATAACTIIRRNPGTGALAGDPATTPGLFLSLSNLGILETSGVDFIANYRHDFNWFGGMGLAFNFVLNWTDESKFQASPIRRQPRLRRPLQRQLPLDPARVAMVAAHHRDLRQCRCLAALAAYRRGQLRVRPGRRQ